MEVIVEDKQLSLAIGKKGQNVRLAAKLTGWKIDIKSEEEKRREVEAQFGALEIGEPAPRTASRSDGDEPAGGGSAGRRRPRPTPSRPGAAGARGDAGEADADAAGRTDGTSKPPSREEADEAPAASDS